MAKFELGEGPEPELREARVLRQRQASDLIDRLLAGIGYGLNMCRDGSPPTEGMDLEQASPILEGIGKSG